MPSTCDALQASVSSYVCVCHVAKTKRDEAILYMDYASFLALDLYMYTKDGMLRIFVTRGYEVSISTVQSKTTSTANKATIR